VWAAVVTPALQVLEGLYYVVLQVGEIAATSLGWHSQIVRHRQDVPASGIGNQKKRSCHNTPG